MAFTLLNYLLALYNLCSLQTLLHNPISGLWFEGDIANSFTKTHALHGPLLVQITFVYLACP